MNIVVETDRLIIKEFEEADVPSLYKIESDKKIIEFLPWVKLSNEKECRRQIKKYINEYKKNKLNSWAVAIKETGEIIGITRLIYSNKIKGVELGTKILPEYWNKGYASELSRAIVDYGLYELGIDEITAVTDINNVGAIKSLINMGMQLKKYGYYNGTEAAFYSIKRE
ncbi:MULTISPECIES: GNAT family N-acetyltransferase [unclassified Sedimentibacter]|uniref:GNAT family N-acetyltransferase n=1 Tax=unclassified Sedimentibacter TaxID=2649220 RepID=UPI0027E0B632|nr:GNAT family N-acetyltransferase [Sedimentibacter sp. MB35-C1]WMJ76701.1 GNAT family N-acetyltransferase [Sedimentibacter sp. MB35-C1]